MGQDLMQKNTLVNLNNYGPLVSIATNPTTIINLDDIDKSNWRSYYNSILNLLKDGIYTDYLQQYQVTVVFHDGTPLELSVMDLYMNIIMWRLLVATNTPIMPYHVFFDDEMTANSIKDYIDTYFISENRTEYGNKELSNIIADTLQCFHDIDQFSNYLANTLNLEDTIELMNVDDEFYNCLHASFSGLPLDEVKDAGMRYTNKSIDRIKLSRDKLGYDHCLADAWRAREGINPKQYMETTIGIGVKPDGRGGIFNKIVSNSFVNGGVTDPVDYFIESSVSRVAQFIKFKNVSSSGSFARIMGLNNMDTYLYRDPNYDCHTKHLIAFKVKSAKHLEYINLRWYREVPNGIERCINYKRDKHLIGKTIYLRDPCTCASAARGHGVCYKCYGKLAYSIFDIETQMGVNIGRIASELITAKQTQKQLSVKHILEAKIDKLNWSPAFSTFFIMNEDIIQIDPELENPKDYKILIDPDMIDLENDAEDSGVTDDDDIAVLSYNEFITEFDVLQLSTGQIYHISNDKEEKLYITNELNGIIRKKAEPVEGKVAIGFNEIKDYPMFAVQMQNNEITQTLNHLKHLYNKSSDVKGKSISSLLQEILDTNIDGTMNIAAVHYSILLMNQIRSTEEILDKPDWDRVDPNYQILTLNESLNYNPAVTISLSYQKITKMMYAPLTYRKHGASFMDLFFMERPQRIVRGLPDETPPVKRRPGEFYEPVIFSDDPNKITSDDGDIDEIDEFIDRE